MVNSLKNFYVTQKLLLKLSRNDFWSRYTSSQFGILWAFLQPLITVLVYWFVFQVGFRVVPLDNVPYLLWLMCGLLPWFFFSEALSNATNSFMEYSYLVKKVVFRLGIVPSIKIISALFVHLFFLVILFYTSFFYGFDPTIYNLQMLYYLCCLTFFVFGLSYITASIVIFFRDLSQIVMIVLQFGVWLTPIMWQPTTFSSSFQFFIKLNPLYYIVEGYRDSLFNEIWFWEKPLQTLLFWGTSLSIFAIGLVVFKRLKPHFSDIL